MKPVLRCGVALVVLCFSLAAGLGATASYFSPAAFLTGLGTGTILWIIAEVVFSANR